MLGSFSLMLWIPLLFLVILLLELILLPYFKVNSYRKLGATTYFFPITGLMHYFRSNFASKGDVLGNTKEASKRSSSIARFMVTNVGTTPFIVLQDPLYIKELLQKQTLHYKKSRVADTFKLLVGNGLITSEGEIWKRHRKLISNSFSFEFLKNNIKIIRDTAKKILGETSPQEYNRYSVFDKMQEITGQVVGKIFFSENLNSYTFEGKPLTHALEDIAFELAKTSRTAIILLFGVNVLKYPVLPQHKKIMKRVKDFRKKCLEIINDRKTRPQQTTDLLSSLLETQKSDDLKEQFSDENIVDEFVSFFIAGMETTAHLIGMTLYLLTQYPQYIQALQEERDATYNLEKDITTDTLHKMDCLHSLLKETLRFYSPAPMVMSRLATTDHKLLDLEIHKGDIVTCNLLAPAFNPKYFDNPLEFNPGRWRHPGAKVDPFSFTPFSAGPRNCIGQHLAMIEAKIIISEFLEKFDFKLIGDYELKMQMKLVYQPEKDIIFNLQQRS